MLVVEITETIRSSEKMNEFTPWWIQDMMVFLGKLGVKTYLYKVDNKCICLLRIFQFFSINEWYGIHFKITWKIHGNSTLFGNPRLYLNVKLFFFLKLSSFYLFLTAFCPYYQGPPCMGPGPYLSCGIIDTMLLNLNVIKKNNEPWDRSPGPCDPN